MWLLQKKKKNNLSNPSEIEGFIACVYVLLFPVCLYILAGHACFWQAVFSKLYMAASVLILDQTNWFQSVF